MKRKSYVSKNRLYLGGKRKPYVSKNRLYLGGRRKQKGGFFFPPAIGIGFKIVKKLLGVRRKRNRCILPRW